ncbi:ribosome maturation factor RimP [Pectinatus brassicae]|uniref:Ribosome maturation factor RimP n=1 Tax=Pectinatus brassicae TaxID=862415 RepID=A0A840USH7_9FIRM|nr:ribosome maturation factor RimP [Pectinatus brassicae]MBB5335913.1 ribosome maturation factor RimP [Pectinatus brassicae]
MAGQIETKAEKLVQDLLLNTEYELVDIEYIKEKNWYLRIYIDKDGGIDLDDCQKLSHEIDDEIEKQNIIKDSYILEISSPGLDRQLKKDRDFERELGKDIDIVTYTRIDGKKKFTGKLTAFNAESVTIDEDFIILRSQISSVRLHIDF